MNLEPCRLDFHADPHYLIWRSKTEPTLIRISPTKESSPIQGVMVGNDSRLPYDLLSGLRLQSALIQYPSNNFVYPA